MTSDRASYSDVLNAAAPSVSALPAGGEGSRRCAICGAMLSVPLALVSAVCTDPRCRVRAALEVQRPAMRREADEIARRRREEREALRAQLLARASEERARRAGAAGLGDPASQVLGFVPSNDLPLVPLPAERAAQFLAHLAALQGCTPRERSDAEASPPLEPNAEILAVSVQRGACTLCRGWCCRAGKEHAFQDEDSVSDVRRAHPELSDADLLARYAAHLPAMSFEGACVFQAATGCALPRELRGRTCNRHLCSDLRELALALHAPGAAGAFVAAHRGVEIARVAFLPLELPERADGATESTI